MTRAPRRRGKAEQGATLLFVAISMAALIGFAALVIDVGRIFVVRAELQTAADAAAQAAAYDLPDSGQAQVTALAYADANDGGDGPVLGPAGVQTGFWDSGTRTFTDGGTPLNAVKVTAERSDNYNNPVTNLLASAFGKDETNVSATAIALKRRALIDFEGLGEGAQPNTVSTGNGISGDPIDGEVSIAAYGGFGPMIFDSTCDYNYPAGCSGGDADLETPSTGRDQGSILINSEDGDASDPDDLGGPCPSAVSPPPAPAAVDDLGDFATYDCTIGFDFTGFGSGAVTIEQVTLVDVEEDALVWLYNDGVLVATVVLQEAGDHQVAVRPVDGAPAADFMVVQFFGSGGVDDVGYNEVVSLVG